MATDAARGANGASAAAKQQRKASSKQSPAARGDATALKPPLKWAGGKRWLVPRLAPVWTHYRTSRLVEPFCGGLAVALGLQPKRALLADINPHTINFYRQLQTGLVTRLKMRNDRDVYLQHRATFNELIRKGRADTARAAALFYFLNRTGYNGLCRFNKSGEFNVPFGSHRSINYVRNFTDYATPLADWAFECTSFESLAIQAADFVYADPPYDVEFTSYAAGGFDWAQQETLAKRLATHPGPVLASNQATQRVLELYADHGFAYVTLPAPRSISRTGDRSPAEEMIAYRNLNADAERALLAHT